MLLNKQTKVRSNLYLDKDLKQQAKKIFKKYGLTLSDAVNLFLAQSVYSRGIPFKIQLPNEETIKAMEETRQGINLESVTFEELKKEAKDLCED